MPRALQRAVAPMLALMLSSHLAHGQQNAADPGAAVPAERPEQRPADLPQSQDASNPEAASTAATVPAAEAAPEGADVDLGGQGAAPQDLPAEEPPGPPAHSLLREDDFAFEACRLELARLGTAYTMEAPITDPSSADCGIDRPLKVTAILPGVDLTGGALMRCDTARALGWWMRDVVAPAARRLPGAPRVTAVAPGSTYQCRETVGATTAKLSEHALGNAFDVASFTFDDGTTLPVAATDRSDSPQAFLLAVRWGACMIFTTVLGPGSNAAHDNHLHLDIKTRRGDFRLCE